MSGFTVKNGESVVTGDFTKLNKLVENLSKKLFVDIGVLGETNKTVEGGLTIAGIGAVHEFGTDKAGRSNDISIPERSFIRMPLETGQDSIEKTIEPKIKQYIAEENIEGLFKLIGIAGEARIKEAFETAGFGTWEANAPSTIKSKGSDSPLIDTGELRKSITSKVGGK